jgi:signal transduction histidine kinase/CheY-like chemotaxis protein
MVGLPPLHRDHTVSELKTFVSEGLFSYVKKFQQDPPEDMKTFEIEVNVRRVDGQKRHCIVCGETIIGSSGKIKKIHGTMQDITERKLMESELKNAKLKAEESDRLKSAFLANMSHEIRTPLNGILGFSELLKHKNLTVEKRLFYIDIICSNGKQLLNVISDIIDISKIESGQITIDNNSFCPETMLSDLHEHLKTELKAKGKPKIGTRELPDLNLRNTSIVADEIHLKQVLMNLLSNAVKFTNTGQISLGYEIRKSNIEYFVSDTGIGIQAGFHKLIFERFRQANESASREHGGTGLGLAICKNLVELMGGKIWVVSTEGKGSEFRFSLPLIISSVKVDPEIYSAKDYDYSWPGKKILIVEDDNASMELLKETLRETYAVVYNADDGEKALLMHENINPDLILMDIRMPKLNGLEAIQLIRKTDPAVPIIAITAHAFVEDRINCKTAGADDYISKPVDQALLLSKIERFLGETVENLIHVTGEEIVKNN